MTQPLSPAEQALHDAALEYHRAPVRGKIAVTPLKPLMNQRDLSLAYSPGVAYPCLAIEQDPSKAAEYTSRGNLVAVVTNGTAVLGLGNIGPLAAKMQFPGPWWDSHWGQIFICIWLIGVSLLVVSTVPMRKVHTFAIPPNMALPLLALPDHVDELAEMNVDHVTITINMVDPAVGAKIYPWIYWDHRRVTGYEAAKILHERQMLGLEMLTARGILTKINSVMIPGVNDEHLIEVNKWVRARGAFLHNVMPLISAAEHGTHFGLTGQRGPTPAELKARQGAFAGMLATLDGGGVA